MKVNLGKYPKNSERRIDVRIENHDTWNLDHTLSLIILPALLQLKATKHGVPSDFANTGGDNTDTQYSFDFYSETADEAFNEKVKQWDTVLDKMIWSFQQLSVAPDYEEKYFHGKSDISFAPSGNGNYTLVDKNPGNHWYDHVGHTLHEKRIQEGIDLFAKYYRALWD